MLESGRPAGTRRIACPALHFHHWEVGMTTVGRHTSNCGGRDGVAIGPWERRGPGARVGVLSGLEPPCASAPPAARGVARVALAPAWEGNH
eukprot:187999-Alexandrium_andersonii.AAC.1